MDAVSLDQFEALFDAAPLGIVAIDAEGRIIRVNPALEQMFAYPPGLLVGQPLELLLPERLRHGHQAHRQEFLRSPHTRPMGQGLDLLGRRRDGRVFPVEVSLTHLALDGRDTGVAFVADVSERTRLTSERDRLLEHEHRARLAAEAIERRQALFAEACRLLASSLDDRTTLGQVARLALPALGEACAIYIAAGPALELVAVAADPAGAPLEAQLRAVPPGDLLAAGSGRPRALAELEAAWPAGAAWLAPWRAAGAHTLLIVPCAVRGAVLGVMVLALSLAGRSYSEVEGQLAEALAVQIAQAVTNAQLFQQAQLAAQQHENALAQLHTFVESAPIGLGFLDAALRFQLINTQLAQLTGLPTAAHIGRSIDELLPDFAGRISPAIRDALASGRPSLDLEVATPADGALRPARQYLVSAYPVRTAAGTPLGLGVVVQDMTVRRQAEEALRLSQQRFRAIFNNAPLGIALVDPDGRPQETNPAFQQLLGYRAEELRGMSPQQFVHPDDLAEGVKLRDALMAEERGQATLVRRFIHADGSPLHVSITASYIRDAGGSQFLLIMVEHVGERLQAEEARARLAAIVNSTDDAIIGATLDETIFAWNAGAERLYGYSAAEIIGRSRYLIVPPDRRDELQRINAALIAGQGVAHVETQRLHRDGRLLDVALTYSPIADATGALIGISTIARDIGERKRVEQLLLRQAALTRLLQRVAVAANEAVAVHGALRTALDAVSDGLGWEVGLVYLAGDTPGAALLPTDIRRGAPADLDAAGEPGDLLGQVQRSGQPEWVADIRDHPAQPRLRRLAARGLRAGLAFPVLIGPEVVAVLELFAAAPQPRDEAVLEVLSNVGAQLGRVIERDRAERALRKSEQMYRTLARNLPNGSVLLFDQQLRFTIADGSALAEAGYTREALEGRSIRDVLAPGTADRLEPLYRAALAGHRTDMELDAGSRSYISHFLPVQDEHGAILAGMVTSYDITDLKRVERELREERELLSRRVAERTADLSLANAELARAARLKDEFLANMSHELRTPLNSILGRAEALQEGIYGPIAPRQAEALRGVEESGRHLLSLINDILDLSKIEAGRLELDPGPIDVGVLCHTSLRMVAQLALTQRISLTSTLDGLVETLYADERRLKQILVNLLSNAVKFTPTGGRVGLEVHGDAEGQTATFTIWDTGIGIAAEHMGKLFRPFAQVDSTLSRQYAGTGLGLALVLRLAEAHGGSVAVESAPGVGSRFSVTLPWFRAAQLSSPPLDEPALGAALAPRRVLVIEDSATAAGQLRRYLNELGAHVESQARGEAAVDRAIALRPDLLFLDILLPDRSGWDVLRALKADPQTQAIPVVVVSVVDEPAIASDLGAAAFLLKPISRAALIEALQIVARSRAATAPPAPAGALPGSRRVLIAEDNQANIDVLQDYLQARGFGVTVARSGSEAIAASHELRPDIILMDIQMPGMDGLEATRRLRADEETRAIPIIAITALAMPGDRERCLEAGATAYLAKPLNLRGVLELIDAQLREARP